MKVLTFNKDTAIIVDKIVCLDLKDRVVTIVYMTGRLIATYESAEEARSAYNKMLEFIKDC